MKKQGNPLQGKLRGYTQSRNTRFDLKGRRDVLQKVVVEAGELLMRYFGRIRKVRTKGHASSVVCEADLASEDLVIRTLVNAFPEDAIIAEESGYRAGTSGLTWAIDPLDGTSNFVAGIPWFGAQIGLLQETEPVLGAIFLPVDKHLFLAEKGRGLVRNGKTLLMSKEANLKNVLCAFGFDPGMGEAEGRRTMSILRRIASGARNIRATNSLVDFVYTLEGRLGGAVNLNARIWDIVPFAIMLPEAGGKLTDIAGKKILFDPRDPERKYTIVGASRLLHPRLMGRIQ